MQNNDVLRRGAREEFAAGTAIGKMGVHLKDFQRKGAGKKLVLGHFSEVNGLPDSSLRAVNVA
jgi:hypothetical protein